MTVRNQFANVPHRAEFADAVNDWTELAVVLAVAAFWTRARPAGLGLERRSREAHARVIFPLGALGGVVLAATAFFGLVGGPQTLVLPLGLPDLPFHLRLDPLSAFFLLLLGAASTGVSLHAAGYFQTGGGGEIRLICLQYHVFLAAMVMVLLADDAYAFMVAWELMALASYFLVTTDHAPRGDPPRGPVVPGGRAHRRDGDPAVLRRAPARHVELHVRRDARERFVAGLGRGRLLARAVRLRRESRVPARARLAARSAPGGALAGVGADERRDAQDRDLWPAAGEPGSAAPAGVVVGCGGPGARPVHRLLRRHLRRCPDRHEAPACLVLHREHRHRPGRRRARAHLSRLRDEPAGGALRWRRRSTTA